MWQTCTLKWKCCRQTLGKGVCCVKVELKSAIISWQPLALTSRVNPALVRSAVDSCSWRPLPAILTATRFRRMAATRSLACLPETIVLCKASTSRISYSRYDAEKPWRCQLVTHLRSLRFRVHNDRIKVSRVWIFPGRSAGAPSTESAIPLSSARLQSDKHIRNSQSKLQNTCFASQIKKHWCRHRTSKLQWHVRAQAQLSVLLSCEQVDEIM